MIASGMTKGPSGLVCESRRFTISSAIRTMLYLTYTRHLWQEGSMVNFDDFGCLFSDWRGSKIPRRLSSWINGTEMSCAAAFTRYLAMTCFQLTLTNEQSTGFKFADRARIDCAFWKISLYKTNL